MGGDVYQPIAADPGRPPQDHDAVVEQLVAADAVLVALGGHPRTLMRTP